MISWADNEKASKQTKPAFSTLIGKTASLGKNEPLR